MDCKSAYHIVSGRTGIERSKDHCGKALRLKYTALPGWSTGCIQEARTLKSRIRVTYRGCESDADPRKVKVLLCQTELKDQRSKKPAKKKLQFRNVGGRLVYRSADKPDIAFSLKERARGM